MQSYFNAIYIFSLLSLPTILSAAPGTLDTSFGTDGITLTHLSRTDFINSCTVQPDDNIVVAGSADGYINRIGVARYTSAGSLDTTFNSTGTIIIPIGVASSAQGITLQSDDKIILTGYGSAGQTDISFVRLLTDGTVDTSVTTPFGDGAIGNAILQQPDTNILIGGVTVSGQAYFGLVRYDINGTLDTGFGSGGKVSTTIGYYAICNDIALQSNGKIIAGGESSGPSGTPFTLVRYNTDGSIDTTFGTNSDGIVLTGIGNEAHTLSIAIQDNDYIVAAGYTVDDADGIIKFALARYDANGNLDSSFGTSGVVKTQIRDEAKAYSVLLQPDGKILVGGYSYGDLSTDFAIARYNSDGSLDTSFGTNGITLTNLGNHNSESHITSLALQSTGNIIAAGYSDSEFALARYLGA